MVELCHSRRIIKEKKANVVDIVWKTAFIQDDLAVPPGTTILIGSVSHLSNVGISAYAEELAAVSRRLHSFFEGRIYCLPSPFILCSGSNDPVLVRSTTELVSWFSNILGKEVFYTPVSMELCARKILVSSLPTADSPPRRLLLPASLTTLVKKVGLRGHQPSHWSHCCQPGSRAGDCGGPDKVAELQASRSLRHMHQLRPQRSSPSSET